MSKEQITKIAKLVAQRRQQQEMVKEAGMQKTALVGAGQLMRVLRSMGSKGFQKRVLSLKNPRISSIFAQQSEIGKKLGLNLTKIREFTADHYLRDLLRRNKLRSSIDRNKLAQLAKKPFHIYGYQLNKLKNTINNRFLSPTANRQLIDVGSSKITELLKSLGRSYNYINETPISKLFKGAK